MTAIRGLLWCVSHLQREGKGPMFTRKELLKGLKAYKPTTLSSGDILFFYNGAPVYVSYNTRLVIEIEDRMVFGEEAAKILYGIMNITKVFVTTNISLREHTQLSDLGITVIIKEKKYRKVLTAPLNYVRHRIGGKE